MGFAMILALPAMLLVGTLMDLATAGDVGHSQDEDNSGPQSGHGDLLDDDPAA